MSDETTAGGPPADPAGEKPPFTVYPFVFLATAFVVGFLLFKGVGSLVSPEDAPPGLVSVARSTAAAAAFGLLFLIGLVAVHMGFRIPAYKSELLLLQALPAVWMLLCFDGFKDLEPEGSYNSGAYLILAGIWFFNRKEVIAPLLAARVRTWGMAALFCGTGFLSGLLLVAWLRFSWAGLPMILQGLLVMAFIAPAPPGPVPAPPRPRALRLAALALVAVVGLGAVFFFFSGPVAGDNVRAYLGSQDAQVRMGWRYREGKGVPRDYARAALFFGKAAEAGSARAQYDLGVLQYYGLGVPDAEGVRAFEQAALQNYAPALTMLGLIARQDDHDPPKAMELWRRAVALDDPFAEYLLGTAYLDLSLRDPDERTLARALYWLERARRRSVNPVGNLLPQIWATVPEESLERVTQAVFRNLEKGTEP